MFQQIKILKKIEVLSFCFSYTPEHWSQEIVAKAGKCVVHVDDNFDGRIRYSDIFSHQWTSDGCLEACKNAKIKNCQYTNDGICKYELFTHLKVQNTLYRPIQECVITSTGISIG